MLNGRLDQSASWYTQVRTSYNPFGNPAHIELMGVIGHSTETLGDLEEHHKLHAHCSADLCHHNAPMDITALRRRLGDDFPLRDLAGRMCCTSCGGRKILTIISPVKTGQ
jgi:hypothetical protein